jgi:hypothetical protein
MTEKTQFDEMLSAGLHDALDGQRGRALAAFREQPRTEAMWRWRPALWSGLGLAAAAVLAVSVWIGGEASTEPSTPLIAQGPTIQPPVLAAGPNELQRYTVWRNYDQGPRVLADNVPVREYRRQVLQQVRWRDPQTQAEMAYTVPRNDLVFVQMTTY